MAYYQCKYAGIEASVNSINRASGEEELNWLMEQTPCLCQSCRDKYEKDYSVTLRSGYDIHTVCRRNQSISSTRYV